jgi:hypothetical protein
MDGHWAFHWLGFRAFWPHRRLSESVSNSQAVEPDFTGLESTKTFRRLACSQAAEIKHAL